jgi:predicted flap endonuclease-1-like 5' DNA nuclease
VRIQDVEGIGPGFGQKLADAGVDTTDKLLAEAGSRGGRTRLAASTGLSEKQLLEWVNHVDLMRIDGVGSEYADLLEAAGVDSCAELVQRNAATLAMTFQELDAARPNVIRRIPTEADVAGWIAQARTLPQVVSH